MNQQQLVSYLGLAGFVMVLVAQPVRADTVKVRGISLKPTTKGIEIILATTDSKRLQVFASSYRNTFVANILNTQLQLPSGNTFRQSNPIEGIAAVSVNQVGANSIRIIVTGKTQLPRGIVTQSDASGGLRQRGLILSLTAPSPATATKPTPTPATPPSAQPPQPTNPDTQLSPETPIEPTAPADEAAQPEAGENEEIEIVVTGEQEEGYSVPNASTATRTDTPIRDIPQSIQVIPKQVIQDQQVTRIEEVLRNVSGVTFQGNDDSRGAGFSLRGFSNALILRDGFRLYSNYSNQGSPETANLERVEVLKGPASVLYGEIEPGGLINLVSKQPLNNPFYQAELQLGSRELVRPRIDISGPLTTDGSLLYRLNALYQHRESFRNYDTDAERFFAAPTLTWKISDRTDLTLALEYLDDESFADFGTIASGNGVADIPASYAYIDAEVTEDNDPDIVGSRLTGIPKHSASLWTTYEIQSGRAQGLGFGIGFNYVGEREGDLDNSFQVGSYFLTNAAIFYRRNNWRFALNFKNLFDVNYIEAAGNSRVRGIYPGEPFTVIGSVSVEF